MTSTPTRRPSRALAILFLATCTALLLGLVSAGAEIDPGPHGSTQEPPPARTLWDRTGAQLFSLMQRRSTDPAREALTQAMEPLGVLDWHRGGQRGKGVKVCVLDSGFKGYRLALGKALPATVTVRSFRKDGRLEARESQHGILCGEVIHHLAPEAELMFANWEPETPSSFLDAVRWARQQGAGIISCSVIMPSWSDGEGGGPTHQALRSALGDGLFFASAGNTAQRHWAGTPIVDKDGWQQWAKGKKDNAVKPYGNERVSVELTSGAGRYELVVVDAATQQEIGRSRTAEGATGGVALVRFEPSSQHRYVVRVKLLARENGKPVGRFHLTVLGGRLQYAMPSGSIPFPADGASVVAVGAVDGKGRRMSYSSCGPCACGPKPDLSASVPFPSAWRPEQAFAGTSAAAPQAAGVAALVWARHPRWSARQVRETLAKAAVKVKPGHCVETGFGMVRLPK